MDPWRKVPGDVGKGAISKGVKGHAASAVAAVGNGEVPGCLGIIRTFSLEKGLELWTLLTLSKLGWQMLVFQFREFLGLNGERL